MIISYFKSLGSNRRPAPILAGSNIIIDGNSIVFGAVVGPENSFPSQLALLPPFDTNGATIINLGINGQKTTQMSAKFNTDVRPLRENSKTNFYLACEGTNDIYFGSNGEDAYLHMRSLCVMARTAGFYVYPYTVTPRSNAGTPVDFEDNRQIFNSRLRSTWAQFCDGIVDIAADARVGQFGDQLDLVYYADEVHPTIEGQSIWAEKTQFRLTNL